MELYPAVGGQDCACFRSLARLFENHTYFKMKQKYKYNENLL